MKNIPILVVSILFISVNGFCVQDTKNQISKIADKYRRTSAESIPASTVQSDFAAIKTSLTDLHNMDSRKYYLYSFQYTNSKSGSSYLCIKADSNKKNVLIVISTDKNGGINKSILIGFLENTSILLDVPAYIADTTRNQKSTHSSAFDPKKIPNFPAPPPPFKAYININACEFHGYQRDYAYQRGVIYDYYTTCDDTQ